MNIVRGAVGDTEVNLRAAVSTSFAILPERDIAAFMFSGSTDIPQSLVEFLPPHRILKYKGLWPSSSLYHQ